MEKNERYQLELFNQPKNSQETRNQDNFSLLGYIRAYEKIILFIICFIITGIISFSLGVEKGKKHSIPQVKPKYDLAENQKQIITAPVVPETTPQNIEEKKENAPKKEKADNYTIQIASFKNKASAQKEADALNKNGWTSVIQHRGNYNVICVGNFENKEKAENLLTEIRKKYQDGFIRRL